MINQKRTNTIITLLTVLLSIAPLTAQQDSSSSSTRVGRLLNQMTLDEKLTMIHGTAEDPSTYQGQAGYLPGIKRLGIPPLRFADGPPGVLTIVPSIALTATMGLAATFSREDARANGTVIGSEARSHGIAVALQPFVNIDRDLFFGRSYNTFGEDPFLTGQLAGAEIQGIQSQHVMAQVKHYIGYDTDGTNVFIDQQTLHEVYAAPFDWAVKAGVSSIMCSYNKINGAYACGNLDTLTTILREQIGFEGFVTSDWGAVHATDFINAGTDMEMPGPLREAWAGPSYFVNGSIVKQSEELKSAKPKAAPLTDGGLPEERPLPGRNNSREPPPPTDLKRLVAEGKVSEETIASAARRVLLEMDKFGFLDGVEKFDNTPSDDTANAVIIEKTAEDAAVLLKNEHQALPLTSNQLHDLAFIGPGANQTIAVGMTSEKAVGLPGHAIGPLAALQRLAKEASAIKYAVADDMEGVPVPSQLFSHDGHRGLAMQGSGVSRTDGINYTLAQHSALPADSNISWSGTLRITEPGEYRLHLQNLGCYAMLNIDDQIVARNGLMWIHGTITQAGQDNIFPTLDGLDNLRAAMHLEAGTHTIKISVTPDSSHAPTQVRFNWVTPSQQAENYRAAIEIARRAKTAVVFAWSRNRQAFNLPGDQDKLVHDIAAVNSNTIVVLNVSQPVAMPWLGSVKAVLQMWWPGDEGGPATAKLLLGKVSPAGRLPFTWPKRMEDTPVYDPEHPERTAKGVDGRTTFSEGIFIGYRWFDAKKIEPVFPFGFGLSYSHFSYSDFKVDKSERDGVNARVTIRNDGTHPADEVAQVYVGKPSPLPDGGQFAENVLGGFERVHLAPNEGKTIIIHVPLRQFQFWSTTDNLWMTPPGRRIVWVGGSSRDVQQKTSIDSRTLATGSGKTGAQ